MIGFGSHIKARRTKLGMTLRDVECITNGQISNAYLSQLENGKIKSPSVRIAFALAAAYHLEASEMLDWLSEGAIVKSPPLCPTCGRIMIDGSLPSDSGSDRNGEDPKGLSAPASQSGPAKTGHRPKGAQ